jgi:hypothetical protein
MQGVNIMFHEGFTAQHRLIGRAAAWAVFFLIVAYAITTILGFISLKSPQDPIGDPYFTIMELLIIILAPLLVIIMIAVHAYAAPGVKAMSFIALTFMIVMAVITSGVHFTVLTVSRQIQAAGFTSAPLLFSFQWPSVAYTLDILAWDWFFALSILFAVPVFKGGRLERILRYFMIGSGVLSLVGLLGVPLAIMKVEYWSIVRNIGIVGYALVAPVAFLLMGILFGRARQVPVETQRKMEFASRA